MQISTWRIIRSSPATGAWNMALDEAILDSVGKGESPSTLRLYSWAPPCLSLGYAQPVSDVDFQALRQYGWDLVRRPTGGRAILHTDELTYAVVAPLAEPRVAGGVLESYQRLSQALSLALQMFGLPVQAETEYTDSSSVTPKGPVCFDVPSNYEITVRGKKIIGSAQARRKDGILQHGSLPLFGDIGRITHSLVFTDTIARQEAAVRLIQRATTVELALGRRVTWEEAADKFEYAFCKALNLQLVSGEPMQQEIRRAEELVKEKYGNPVWNERV